MSWILSRIWWLVSQALRLVFLFGIFTTFSMVVVYPSNTPHACTPFPNHTNPCNLSYPIPILPPYFHTLLHPPRLISNLPHLPSSLPFIFPLLHFQHVHLRLRLRLCRRGCRPRRRLRLRCRRARQRVPCSSSDRRRTIALR